MVKLSYVTRKIEGVKLATSVCKDIRKKIPKEGLKPAKRSVGTVSDNIELNLTGKSIGDEGIALISQALIEGLEAGHFRLVELHLSGTSITVTGLTSLAPVIRAAASQLKDIDLSSNKISVRSASDVLGWEDFLMSFSNVCCLIRLDLSGNPLGSEFAGETLLRCYSSSKPIQIDSNAMSKDSGVGSANTQLEISPNGQDEGTKKLIPINTGLRSIPLIVLRDFDITVGFALHVSYIIEAHLPANILLKMHQFGQKMGTELFSFVQSVEEPDEKPYCGVIYSPVRSISSNAHSALEAAVKEVIPEPEETDSEYDEQDFEDSPRVKVKKVQLGVFDATRCRIKLQGSVLQEGSGTSLVQLWDVAVKMLSATRALMLTKDNRKLFAKRLADAKAAARLAAVPVTPVFSPAPRIQLVKPSQPIPPPQPRENYDSAFPTLGSAVKKNSRPAQIRSSTEPPPTTPFKPQLVNKSNRPSQKPLKTSPKSKGTKSWVAEISPPAPRRDTITFVVPKGCTLASLSTLPGPEPLPELVASLPLSLEPTPSFTWHTGPPKDLITPRLPGGKRAVLPMSIWKQILLFANDPNGLLSSEQADKIWNFAVNFDTLLMGLEQMRGRRESDHIWRFLDSVACLTYAIRK